MMIFAAISSFFAKFTPGYKEQVCQQKLDKMFQVDNEVREKNTGHVYKVFDVTLGSALMVDAQDNVRMASWLSSLGRLRPEVADKWELVRSAHA
ncbi:hypothetical protein [Burkholderia ubonensis]|uniref:hypothetical protein n=1 Tax=Burkholderia ubonensis TaxID=101571 RepID=UPI0012F8807C|nr:hypothetical protein [Burkholderia ubonensis]